MKQKFCKRCQGLLQLKINGKVIQPIKWMQYGMAIDIGCVCGNEK